MESDYLNKLLLNSSQDGTTEDSLSGTIYHYCSSDSFLKIITQNSLRLCNISHTNDYLESKYLAHWIIRLTESPEVFNNLRRELEQTSAFISCFSDKHDSLGQWRAYAGKGTGFAIGFDINKINIGKRLPEPCDKVPGVMPIIYSDDEMHRIAKAIISFYSSQNNCDKKSLYYDLVRLSFLCKNPTFKEETERRIIYTPDIAAEAKSIRIDKEPATTDKKANFTLDFREVNGGINPFCNWRFPKEAITNIILGPATKTRRNDVRLLLNSHGYTNVEDYQLSFSQNSYNSASFSRPMEPIG